MEGGLFNSTLSDVTLLHGSIMTVLWGHVVTTPLGHGSYLDEVYDLHGQPIISHGQSDCSDIKDKTC